MVSPLNSKNVTKHYSSMHDTYLTSKLIQISLNLPKFTAMSNLFSYILNKIEIDPETVNRHFINGVWRIPEQWHGAP